MHIIFSDATGRREGVVLAADENHMRVAVRGTNDIVELPLSKHGDSQNLEIESLIFPGPFQGFRSLVLGIKSTRVAHGHKAVA